MSDGSASSMSGSESSSDSPMELCARRPSPPASDVSELSDGVDGDVDDDKLPPLGSAPTGLPFIGYDDDDAISVTAQAGGDIDPDELDTVLDALPALPPDWADGLDALPPPPPADPPARPADGKPRGVVKKRSKRERNKEAAARFRKNRKLRDEQRAQELMELRTREADWRKREEDWRKREAALTDANATLQSRLQELGEDVSSLFSKKNLARATHTLVTGMAVAVAVLCVLLPPMELRPDDTASANVPSTGRSLLSVADYRDSPGVSILPTTWDQGDTWWADDGVEDLLSALSGF